MKISITTIAISSLLVGSVLTSVASAGVLTAEREARTLRIEALTQDVARSEERLVGKECW